ncbi:LysR family transcriptional regulator [Zavarzinia sp. CC-PAN008]|uniref:LysR family transcriptional regulator n=1 Tax=Zavarzinia sp. CC-PAN008 TaxID=3243332 RepID=UPI003F744FC0
MDRLAAMAALVAVVDRGSLSAAARALNLPLPTLSRRLAELEAGLGTRLLLRTTRRLALTDAGVDYLAACRQILEQVAAAERAATGEYRMPKGDLVVTAPVAFGRLHVLPVVADFLALQPQVAVRLALSDTPRDLVAEQIDVAVRIGRLAASTLKVQRVGTIRRVVVASPAWLERHGAPAQPADLAGQSAIGIDPRALETTWRFHADRGERALTLRCRLAVSSTEAAVDAAVSGLGLAQVLHYQAASALRAGALRIVLEAHEPAPAPLSLLHPGQGLLPLKTRAFLDHALPRLRASLRLD